MRVYKNLSTSWCIKLNILVLGLLLVIFLMKQIKTISFQSGLKVFFSSSEESKEKQMDRSVKIKRSLD